jgi:hypothetical protein
LPFGSTKKTVGRDGGIFHYNLTTVHQRDTDGVRELGVSGRLDLGPLVAGGQKSNKRQRDNHESQEPRTSEVQHCSLLCGLMAAPTVASCGQARVGAT